MLRRSLPVFALAVALGLAACAEIARPPGGPVDRTPPGLTSVEPGSLATGVDPDVPLRFTFDEKLDRNAAKRALTLVPDVPMRRASFDDLSVSFEPESTWPADTVVVWTLRTSLSDRHRVSLERELSGAFTTGEAFPPGVIRGRASLLEPDTTLAKKPPETDWTELRAELEIPPPEGQRRAKRWRTAAGDEEGFFELEWLDVPSGPFDLRVYLDGNGNGARDEREPVATLDSLVLSAADTVFTLDPDDLLLIDLEGPVPVRVELDSVVVDSLMVMAWFEVDGERRPRTVPFDTLGVASTQIAPGPLVWGAWIDRVGDGSFGPADSLGTSEPFAVADTLEIFPATPETLRLAWPDSVLPFAVIDTLPTGPVPRDLVTKPPVPE